MYKNGIIRQIKKFKEILRQGKKTKRNYFLGKTFSAKLFIKLCSKTVDSSIICLEILNYEPENKTKEDIETVLPWMKNLKYFYEYISIKETEESRKQILRKFIWLLHRKIFHKNAIIKKNDEMNKFVYIILEGFLMKLNLVFYQQRLPIEDYLLYLIKMEILNEKEIIDKCKLLNKSFIDIDTNSIEEFCIKNDNNYSEMKKKALEDLIQHGIIFPNEEIKNKNENLDYKIKSIENYLKIFLFKSNSKIIHDNRRAYFKFYLGKYMNNEILEKGQYIGTFLREEIKDSSRYIAKDKCIVAVFNKEEDYSEELYKAHTEKIKRLFEEIKNNYFIFHQIPDDIFYKKYIPYMHYRKYTKGEKIFLQNSIYEGIYLLVNGEIKISVNTSIDEMYNIINHLTYSLNNFTEYSSQLKNESIEENSKNKIYNANRELFELYSKKDIYDLITIKDYNIVGTNETYDYKTDIYNFTAECISDSAVLFFFPKYHLNISLKSEKEILSSFIHLVEFRIKDMIWKLKKYINIFERELKHHKNKILKIKMNSFIKNLKKENIKNSIISRNELSDEYKNNNNIFLSRNYSNQIKSRNKTDYIYNSKTNLNEGIKIKNIKKLFSENKKNKEVFLTENNDKKIGKNINIIIPSILKSKNKNENENIISYPKNKKKIDNYIPKSFPYIIQNHFNKNYLFNRKNDNTAPIKPFLTLNGVHTKKIKNFI